MSNVSKGGTLIVSNRLPVHIARQADGRIVSERSIGGVATALDSVARNGDARWVGWTGLTNILQPEELDEVKLPDRYIPVQAGAALIHGFYDNFSNSYAWPVLHGKRPSFTPSEKDWDAYQAMNRRFAEVVRKNLRPGDVIWVHDYHLMLLPGILREMGITNRIGFFLHTPFPRAQYWLRRPYGRQLAEGIAASDVIGMQTRKDAARFRRYLQAADIPLTAKVEAFPIGVDYEAYREAKKRPIVRRLQDVIKADFADKKIIFSLSRMDYTKGILTQLGAVKQFLSHQKNRGKVMYKLVVAPSREHLPEYTQLSKDIERTVKAINKDLGDKNWTPIDYEHRAIGFDEVNAWYAVADALLLLPDADGMNLISKEYVAAREDNKGMPVLSTAMGAAEQLDEALLVPSGNASAAASALDQAFEMPEQKRRQRWHALRNAVREQDIFWWADKFLASLKRGRKK